jgi:hypothetical protein
MILGLEIGLLITGIYALATGKLTLSKNRVVHGPAARALGFVALLPLPLAFLIGFFLGVNAATRGQTLEEVKPLLIGVEIAVVLLCGGIVLGVGLAVARDPEEAAQRELYWRAFDQQPEPFDPWARAAATPSRGDQPAYGLAPATPVGRAEGPKMVTYACSCGKWLQIADHFAGQAVRCPSCQAVQVVTVSAPPTPSPFRAASH